MKKSKHFSPGDKVFAKVKGYPAWPARIDEELGKKYRVYFYGTGETGVVKAEDLFSYIEHKEQFTKPLKRKDYNDALEEIEAALKDEGAAGTPVKANITTEDKDTDDTKRGVKRKLSSDTVEQETKVKKVSPVKNVTESKKNTQTPQATVKKEVATPVAETKAPIKKEVATPLAETKAITKKEVSPSLAETESEEDTKKNNNKESAKPSGKKVLKRKKSNETVPVNRSTDESMEVDSVHKDSMEEDGSKFVLITADQLQKTIEECSKIMMEMDDKEEIDSIPEDLTSLASNAVLLARIEYEKYIGIKINKDRPSHFKNGVERLQWAVDIAQRALDLKEKVEFSVLKPEDEPDLFEFELDLTKEQLQNETGSRIMERKKNKLLWLKIESCLVELDALIKTSLGLDKADPEKALKHLESMLDLTIDPLMLKKHPHVVDMVKRLRRYIGNVKEWNLKDKELTEFKKQAEEIRVKAETVYNKFKSLFQTSEKMSFGEVFQQQVNKFKMQTKDMVESQVFALCAEPGSKQAQWDELDDQEEIKLISEKLGKKKDKENIEENINNEEEHVDIPDEVEATDNHG